MSLPNDLPEEDFLHWVKATLGLQIAKLGSFNYIKRIMTKFINELKKIHPPDREDHFDSLLYKVMFRGEIKLGKVKGVRSWMLYDQRCLECKDVISRILDAFNDINDCTSWTRHCEQDSFKPELHWWIVSKLYMSKKCKVDNAVCPDETDPFAVFSVMPNCKQFEEQVKHHAGCMIALRNKLMHSSNNTLTKKEMENSFAVCKDYLDVLGKSNSNTSQEVVGNSNTSQEVVAELDKALIDLKDLKKKKLRIFDEENKLQDSTERAIQTLQQCLRTDIDVQYESEFHIITTLISRIEREKCKNEKQHLRDALLRSEIEISYLTEKLKNASASELEQYKLWFPEDEPSSGLKYPPKIRRPYMLDYESFGSPMSSLELADLEEIPAVGCSGRSMTSQRMDETSPEPLESPGPTEDKTSPEPLESPGPPKATTKPFTDAKFMKTIDMGVDSDKYQGNISDMCQMSDGAIIVIDNTNKRLKRLDDKYNVKDFCDLMNVPLHVVAISSSEVAVLVEPNVLQFISINDLDKMSVVKEIILRDVFGNAQGMVFFNKNIWIMNETGHKHIRMHVYSLSGELQRGFNVGIEYPYGYYERGNFMSTNIDNTRVYVASYHRVKTFDMNGDELFTFPIKGSQELCCITVTDADILLLSELHGNHVYMYDLNGQLPQRLGNLILKGRGHLLGPQSMLYDNKNCCLIFSEQYTGCLVYQLKK